LYGTWRMFTSTTILKSSIARWRLVPEPLYA
jgi:hypothetical protein